MKIDIILSLALGTALLWSCAKDVSPSTNELNKDYLEKWVQKNYPGAKSAGNGIYILEETEGSGNTYNNETYTMVDNTTSNLNGDITSSTSEKIAKQLGTYNKSYYYGPQTWLMGEAHIPVGVSDLISGMKKGGRRKALIPSWLMGYKRYSNVADYIKNNPQDASTTIYDLTLENYTNDLSKYQIESIERYIDKKYPGLDSTKTGFYYKQLKAPKSPVAKSDTTIYINYTGRLLNGQVFDTTIEDTAKVYSIYSSGKSYKPVGISWKTNYTDIKFSSSGSSSLITGFQLLLSKMGAYEKAVGIFTSDYGYAAKSVRKQIPAFSPLVFEVELTGKPSE